MADDPASKTEEPTARKLSQAHSKGQFAKAEEINMVALLFVLAVMILFYAPIMATKLSEFGKMILGNLDTDILTAAGLSHWMAAGIDGMLMIIMPFMLGAIIASIVGGGYQSGFKPTWGVIKPSMDKFNPAKGLKKIFSTKALMQGVTDLLKVIAIVAVMWGALMDLKDHTIFHNPMPVHNIPRFILDLALIMLFRVVLVMGLIAMINYSYQKWQTHRDMKMTKQEVKDERKMSEGDPLVKRRQRQTAMRLARQQMLGDVSTADVVVTNPTHYAVALKYERGKDLAPIVVAKGENLLARRIKEIAKDYEVPMVENKLLARTLFRIAKVGEAIPAELYQVIADTLAYVYKTYRYYFYRLRARRGGAHS